MTRPQNVRLFLIRVTDCRPRQWLHVGDHTISIYPLLQNETYWFLAVDFDKKTWQRDATAFLAVCCELNVPTALDRSRSPSLPKIRLYSRRISSLTSQTNVSSSILPEQFRAWILGRDVQGFESRNSCYQDGRIDNASRPFSFQCGQRL
jgi:hypothetical protein